MRKIVINNLNIQNFIESKGIKPIEEDIINFEYAIYPYSKRLVNILDTYEIKYHIIKNKF